MLQIWVAEPYNVARGAARAPFQEPAGPKRAELPNPFGEGGIAAP